jgi:hypothetical protein
VIIYFVVAAILFVAFIISMILLSEKIDARFGCPWGAWFVIAVWAALLWAGFHFLGMQIS